MYAYEGGRRGAKADSPWEVYTLCTVSGNTVTALENQGPGDIWPTARCLRCARRIPCTPLQSGALLSGVLPARAFCTRRQLCLRHARQVGVSLYFRCQDIRRFSRQRARQLACPSPRGFPLQMGTPYYSGAHICPLHALSIGVFTPAPIYRCLSTRSSTGPPFVHALL